jgi:hypothetical protein
MKRALPVGHFHVVFTLPAELRPLVREYKGLLLDLLFKAASETILELGLDRKRIGALVGVTGVVHTWGRNLVFHPHLHCIVTGGGLGADGAWVDSREKFLLPVKVLRMLFRGKFLDGLARLFADGKIKPGVRTPQVVADLVAPAAFARLKNALNKKDWVAMKTSAHSSWPMARRRFRARTILVSTAHSRPSMLTAASKVAVALVPSPTTSTFFAHGEKRDFSSRTRGLAQPDV